MKISEAFKVFELNILRQSGVVVTADQVGLKSDPILAMQTQNVSTGFNTVLSRLGMTVPAAPALPTDTSDTAAMSAYQQQMSAYSQNMQLYNQRFMQLMLNQMQQMQQSVARSQSSSSSNSLSSTDSSALGIGGIL